MSAQMYTLKELHNTIEKGKIHKSNLTGSTTNSKQTNKQKTSDRYWGST